MVVSDHSPCTPDLKNLNSGDFTQAWGGISSLQFCKSVNKYKYNRITNAKNEILKDIK